MDRKTVQEKLSYLACQVEPGDAVSAAMQFLVDVTDDAADKYRIGLEALAQLAAADLDALGDGAGTPLDALRKELERLAAFCKQGGIA